jgi:protein ImuB
VARAGGGRTGDSAVQAEAACAGLVAVPHDEREDRAALEALAEALLALGPAVEIVAPDVLLLDASGARLLARGAPDPDALLAARAVALAAELGFHARAAVATGRGPARALARCGTGPRSVAPDATAAVLAALPLHALDLPPAVAARLRGVGIHDAGALARLPAAGLGQRFGAAGVAAWRLARGEDASPLAPWAPSTLPGEAIELDAPVECSEPLLFALKRLCDRVAARLAGRGLGAARLALVLRLDGAADERIELALGTPSAAASRWLLVLRERVSTVRLEGAIVGARLDVAAAAPAPAEQLALADRPEQLVALDAVLARIAARLGDGAAFAAEPVDRHRPEAAYRAAPFRARGGSGTEPPIRSSRSRRSLASASAAPEALPAASAESIGCCGHAAGRPTRLLAAPLPLVAQGEGGRVTAVRLDGRAFPVVSVSEPERLAGEWWDRPFDREYRRARIEGLGECWLSATSRPAGSGCTGSSTERTRVLRGARCATPSCAASRTSRSSAARATRRSSRPARPSSGSLRSRCAT